MPKKTVLCKKCRRDIPSESTYCLYCGKKQAVPPSKRKPRTRGNGMGTAYKRGKTWTAEVLCGKKVDLKTGELVLDRRYKGGFTTKTDALAYVPTLKAGPSVTKQTERPVTTLAVIWDNYSKNSLAKLSKTKQSNYKTAYKKLETIAHRPIASLTISDLQETVDEKSDTFYPARDMKVLLSHLYKRAAAQQDVATNLATYIELPEKEEASPNPFSEEEIKKIWKDYGDGNKIAGYILLMVYSGMMPGELVIARKNMIDWENQRIVGCGLKTKKRKESPIIFSSLVEPVLRDLCEFSKSEKLLELYRPVFYSEFHETLKRCEIEDRTPYACRHTTATALALGNIAPNVIQGIMRHTQFSTTERYIHLDMDTGRMVEAANAMKKG